MKFQIIKNHSSAKHPKATYYWRLLADDGRLVARSSRYATLEACKHDVHYVALSAISISIDSLLAEGDFDLSDLFASGLLSPDATPKEPSLDPATLFPPTSPEYLLEEL